MQAMIEGCVRELYARARLSTRVPHGSVKLATALFGNDCVQYVGARSLPGRAAVTTTRTEVVIHLRFGQSQRELNHAAGREVAQWFLQTAGYKGRAADEVVGRLAAALCVPRQAFDAARRALGDDVPALSVAFGVSQSMMALRVGECVGCSVALIMYWFSVNATPRDAAFETNV
jgi:hypothetical protein